MNRANSQTPLINYRRIQFMLYEYRTRYQKYENVPISYSEDSMSAITSTNVIFLITHQKRLGLPSNWDLS